MFVVCVCEAWTQGNLGSLGIPPSPSLPLQWIGIVFVEDGPKVTIVKNKEPAVPYNPPLDEEEVDVGNTWQTIKKEKKEKKRKERKGKRKKKDAFFCPPHSIPILWFVFCVLCWHDSSNCT